MAKILRNTYVDGLDVNRVPPDLRRGAVVSRGANGAGEKLDIASG